MSYVIESTICSHHLLKCQPVEPSFVPALYFPLPVSPSFPSQRVKGWPGIRKIEPIASYHYIPARPKLRV